VAEHPNAVSVWRSFEAWNSGDLDVIRGYFTDDAVLHFAGNNPMSGTYRGRDAVMDALARASQGWGTHADVDSVLASDDHTMVFYHATDEREGAVMAMKVDAEGKVA
jgi:uncharacterized protein